jgi:nucleotide-binding universal stress UspA family protein
VPSTAALGGEPAGAVACAIDGSPASKRGLGIAAALAEGLGLPLSLLHAVPRPTLPGVGTAPGAGERLERIETREGLELIDELLAETGIDASARRVEVGPPATVLGRLAADERAAVLVVGSRGHGPAVALLVGSVAQDLATAAPCPVILVPPDAPALRTPAT